MSYIVIIVVVSNTFITIAVLFSIIFYVRKKINFLSKHVSNNANEISDIIWTTRAINAHVDKSVQLPRPNLWTLDGAAIETLLAIIEKHKPSIVVELGSGLSTPIIGSALKKYGGKLISLENDQNFAAVTQSYIVANNLQTSVEIRVAELQDTGQNLHLFWYDKSSISDIDNIELLLVDGPPMTIDPKIRQHSLPLFFDKLASSAIVILDDANRPGEKSIIEYWCTNYPVKTLQVRGHPKSHAVMMIEKT